jgi:serine/threonine-protein kinase
LIGKTISHYRIVDKIGQGGMGVVYKAEDTKLHRTVALKFLPAHHTGATQEMKRFIHEARAAAALDHPNICTIYEIDESAKQPFISMAYIEGKNLEDIAAGRPLDLDDALRYASQVARGLEEAHAKGVIHRDIKSANIVVSDKGHAIVMDFGLAKLQGQTKLTQTGTTVGTVSYMSPEQARGDEVDHRSDIWSLGVVLYSMVVGRYPFEGEHPSSVMYLVMNEPHEPLTALRTGVPMELERIVDRALAKDPGERYQSVSDMIVDLKAARGQLSGAKTTSTGPRALKPRSPRRRWVFAGVAVVVAVLGFLAWQQISGDRGAPATERVVTQDERVSIAVLPLDNMSQDEGQEYVADGMTEALIAELAQIRALRVISRTSVMRFKGTTQSIPEVAAVLGVNTIIEGSVAQVGGRVRVTAQLIDAKTDEHLWAQSYERDMSDVLALQSEVARAIADEVKVELTPDETARLASSTAVDPRAYDLYMRGRYHWYRRTDSDLRRALELFQQAVDIQPDWALGYAALAQTNLVMASWSALPPGEAYPRARDIAQKALEIDPDLGSAWACLGGVESEWHWDWKKADEYFRKAIELEPNNASSHQWYSEFLVTRGRFDEAIEHIDVAEKIDPLATIVTTVKAWNYYVMGDFDRAIAECERVIAMDSTFTGAYLVLADACRFAEQHDRAAAAYARFYGFSVPGAAEGIRAAYAGGGMDAVIRAMIAGYRQASETQYVSPADIGFRFAAIGEADSAMVWLERAYVKRAYPIASSAVLPDCEPICKDPRFIDLLQRMKLEDVKPAYARE